ncbi:hypothetical protein CPB84DRAFT_1746495 [Gymnopilus junonius]|uniref:Uncharacterized protein n=1 Tax=Gymnopilus junonius TaxID=109634 RepID=A0A9P5TP81_GYMJU|nr:hypothetical protein CPB84DRAFT_1746495 [Gymnopilus junonius]
MESSSANASAPSSAIPPHPIKPEIECTIMDTVLGLTRTVLVGLKAAAGFIPVPLVRDAVGVAEELIVLCNVRISSTSEKKKNTASCKELTYRACSIVYCAFRKCEDLVAKNGGNLEERYPISKELRDQLQELVGTMQFILKQCKKIADRNPLLRYLETKNDADDISRLTSRLDSAMVMFNEAIEKFAKNDSRLKGEQIFQKATINANANSVSSSITYAGPHSTVINNNNSGTSYVLNNFRDLSHGEGARGDLDHMALVSQISRVVDGNQHFRGFLTA